MKLSVEQAGRAQIAKLAGDMDLHEGGQLSDQLRAFVTPATPHLIVDLSDLEFIGSTGITALVTAHHAAREYGGSVQIVAPASHIEELLRLARIDEFIPIRKNRADALATTTD